MRSEQSIAPLFKGAIYNPEGSAALVDKKASRYRLRFL